jgi:riboflavin kinase, archaea type
MRMDALDILIYLAKNGALTKPIAITTANVGDELGISQQSVSRWLLLLEKEGLTERQQGIRGYMVQISQKGRSHMVDTRNGLIEALSGCNKFMMRGVVVSGMKEGGYYIGLEEYTKKIKETLGFEPFPGTLNVRLMAFDGHYKEKMSSLHGVCAPSFKKDGRTFGALKCFPCLINGVHGAVIIPERSHYGSEVLEVISPFNLRDKLKLSDGDTVKVEVVGYEKL